MLHRHVGDVGLELELTDDHMNSWQMAHGGVIMSMLDIVMGMSAKRWMTRQAVPLQWN